MKGGVPVPSAPAINYWIDAEDMGTIYHVSPYLLTLTVIVAALSLRVVEFRIPLGGLVVFDVTALLHITFADEIKEATGFKNLSSDAFGSFTTLMGLVFSILLGQTYQYYFDRQGTIQDSAFREICALSRLLELVRLLDPPVDVRRSALNILKNYSKDLLNNGLKDGARLIADTPAAPPGSPSGGSGNEAADLHDVLKLIGSAPALSANVVATNLSISPAAATTALQAAHTTVRDIDDARAVRVSNINADLPYAQWLTLNLLGGLLMSSFLLLDLGACAPFFLFLSLSL